MSQNTKNIVKIVVSLIVIVVCTIIFIQNVSAVGKPEKEEPKKVTICHATSSETNPWVRTVVSENATAGHFDNNGTAKAGHEGDKLLQGDVACPVVVVTPPKEEEPVVETPAPQTPTNPVTQTPIQPKVEATPSNTEEVVVTSLK